MSKLIDSVIKRIMAANPGRWDDGDKAVAVCVDAVVTIQMSDDGEREMKVSVVAGVPLDCRDITLNLLDKAEELPLIRADALRMIEEYEAEASQNPDCPDVLRGISSRFPTGGSEAKAMRWLGFCQGVCVERGLYTLDDVKDHSKARKVNS